MKKCFIIVEFFIYLFMTFSYRYNNYLKFFAIVLCFLYSLYSAIKNKKLTLYFLASLFTVIADYFLVYRENCFNQGVFFFCLVQTTYALIINNKKSYLYRILLFLLTITFLKINNLFDLTIILSAYSMINLIINVITSFKIDKVLFIGLLLFMGCDICVGISNMRIYLSNVDENIILLANQLIWQFYLPSQIILAIKGASYEKK